MANRREILQAGLAVPALSLTGVTGLRSSARAEPLEIDCFVSDERYTESLAAAREAARLGIAVHATAGDMTNLWYYRLDELWKQRPVAIAGVTGEDALFVLERLGWDRRLRVMYRGRHEQPVAGRIRHALAGPGSLVRSVAEPEPGAWTDRFARVLGDCSPAVVAEPALELGASSPSVAARETLLMSWLLAPMPRRGPHG